MPLSFTTFPELDVSGAYEIVNDIRLGYLYVWQVTVFAYPRFCYVYWDPLDNSVTTLIDFGCFVNGIPIIIVEGRSADQLGSARDEWDASIVLHEYSHFIMREYAEIPDSSLGPHMYHIPPKMPNQIPRRVAYSEGWADFFPGAILGSAQITDRNNTNIEVWKIDMELPQPDAPYIDSSQFNNLIQTSPSHPTPVYFAYHVEGSIAEALWDLFDAVNDGNYYQFGQLYGHNNDYNSSDAWRGISAIWDVFWNYDPAPADPNRNHCWDFHEFIDGWEARGYPIAGHFTDILNSHGLQICVAIPGDLNADNAVTLADIIHLTNYVFDKDRPATGCLGVDPGNCWTPDPLCRGEINGTSPVTLTDLMHLINYVFDKDRLATNCYGVEPGNCWPPVPTETCCLPLPGYLALK